MSRHVRRNHLTHTILLPLMQQEKQASSRG
jgi:hypothetical protein